MLNMDEFILIFEDFKNIKVTDAQVDDCFVLINEKMDGLITLEEMEAKAHFIMNYKIRNDTLQELKTKFVVI